MPERYMDMSAFEKVGPELDLQWSDFDFDVLTVRMQRGIVHGRVDQMKT